MANFYYDKDEYLDGLLKWVDFTQRNPHRSILDVTRWHELRREWFEDNGYNLPKDENMRRQGTDVNATSYHEAAVSQDMNMLANFGSALDEVNDDD